VLAVTSDLMLGVRIESAAQGLGIPIIIVARLAELRSAVAGVRNAVVVLDLTDAAFPLQETLAALDAASNPRPSVLAFYPHVMRELGRSAERAGWTIVVPRSRFMADLPGLLARAIAVAAKSLDGAAGTIRGL
jgi:hypothetical protein